MNLRHLGFALVLMACSVDPLNTSLPDDVAEWKDSAELKAAAGKMSDEDKEALMGFAARHILTEALGGTPAPVPATVREAIAEQRAFIEERDRLEAEAAALAEKQRRENEVRLARLRKAVTVGLVEKDFLESDYRRGIYGERIAMRLVFQNNTDQDIAGVKGAVVFSDMFGDEIKTIRLSYDEGIKANARQEWAGEIKYNQFRPEDQKLAHTEREKIKMTWNPEVILFTDGSTLK